MVLALDVYYRTKEAYCVGVLFDWHDSHAFKIIENKVEEFGEYISGEFYKRELPCLISLIDKVDLNLLECIIIDGYVYIDDNLSLGLGGKLWKEIHMKLPIIGVAKTSFFSNKRTVTEVYRGESKKPLYVSTIGMDIDAAAKRIKGMMGTFCIPAILKELDNLTKKI